MTDKGDCSILILRYCDRYRSKKDILEVVGFYYPEDLIHRQVFQLVASHLLQKHHGHQRGPLTKYKRAS